MQINKINGGETVTLFNRKGSNPKNMKLKNLLSILVFVLCTQMLQAQNVLPLKFDQERKDLGRVKEQAGLVEVSFSFRNVTDTVVQIERLQMDCGCTTTAYTGDPLEPGELGYVQIMYDPTNRPGAFSRITQVFLKGMEAPINLVIEGIVVMPIINPTREFPHTVGNLRFRTKYVNLGNFTTNDTISYIVDIYNASTETVHFLAVETEANFLKFSFLADTILGSSHTEMEVKYFGTNRNDIGYFTDTVNILTSDEMMPRKPLIITSTIEDYFPPMTREELDRAPSMGITETLLDFGNADKGKVVTKTFKFSNSGASDLVIRKVISNCECVTFTLAKDSFSPGENGEIAIHFDTNKRVGTEYKNLTFFTNDPRYPARQLMVKINIRD
jgi:hypothetical protein